MNGLTNYMNQKSPTPYNFFSEQYNSANSVSVTLFEKSDTLLTLTH